MLQKRRRKVSVVNGNYLCVHVGPVGIAALALTLTGHRPPWHWQALRLRAPGRESFFLLLLLIQSGWHFDESDTDVPGCTIGRCMEYYVRFPVRCPGPGAGAAWLNHHHQHQSSASRSLTSLVSLEI